jgi:hypothetical protein
MTIEDYKKKFTQWGEDRGIYTESTLKDQVKKWGEERAEMLIAETKEELMDAIGDQFVCLVHCENIGGGKPVDLDLLDDFEYYLSDMDTYIARHSWAEALLELEWYTSHLKLNFLECLEMTWMNIKDRKGKMVKGQFVKEAV